MSKDWWEGKMFSNEFNPYEDLQNLKIDSITVRNTINTLVHSNNRLSDLLVELSQQHRELSVEATKLGQRLNALESELMVLRREQKKS